MGLPVAQRSAIVRRLKKLDGVVSLSAVDPIRDGRGWAFREGRGNGPDPVNGFAFLSEAYEVTEPGYDGHVSVPVLWDRQIHHFKTNLRRLVDCPNLWAYARDLYQRPEFGETTDFDHIKRHYFMTHPQLNPARIVPVGPELDWEAPHGRGGEER